MAAGEATAAVDPRELRKRRLQIAAMTFNFTFMAAMGYQMFLARRESGFLWYISSLGIAIALGAAAAGAAFSALVVLRK